MFDEERKKLLKKSKKVKTRIFKGISFYLDQRVRREKSLENIIHVIKENSGSPYSEIKKDFLMYCVLHDSLEA